MKIPKITFCNYRKQYKNIGPDAFRSWFSVRKFWSGKIVKVTIKHFQFSFDFRRDWISDLKANA